MKPKENSPSNDFQINIQNDIPLSKLNQIKNISMFPSNGTKEKNMIENQEGDEQSDFINFNVSFFFPKDIYKNIAGDDEKSYNKNNSKIISKNILNINPNNNNSNTNNNFDLSKNNDINDDYLDSNQNNFPIVLKMFFKILMIIIKKLIKN